MREKIHRKYIQIIGHHKRKVLGVLIMGILGMGFCLSTQVDINLENEIDTTREGFVKGDSI